MKIIEISNKRIWLVSKSNSRNITYSISYNHEEDKWTCECEGFIFRGICSHIKEAKELLEGLNEKNR